jgi:hypothetical protein
LTRKRFFREHSKPEIPSRARMDLAPYAEKSRTGIQNIRKDK